MTLHISPVTGLPEIAADADLAALIVGHLPAPLRPYDIVVVTSKVVSKAAGHIVTGRREDLIAQATERVVATRGRTRIVRTRHGLTMAAAGLDESNTTPGSVVALPPTPDTDAAALRSRLIDENPELAGRLAVVITDTAGRAWRTGQTDLAIGTAGITPSRSYAGTLDPYGNELAVTEPAIADEIAAAAELATGKLARAPVSIVSGLESALFTTDDGPGATALIRPESEDLFGLGAVDAVRAAASDGSERPRGFPTIDADAGELAALGAAGFEDRLDVRVAGGGNKATLSAIQRADVSRDVANQAVGALRERLRILVRAAGADVTAEPTESAGVGVQLTVCAPVQV